jgi:hypothetical protein
LSLYYIILSPVVFPKIVDIGSIKGWLIATSGIDVKGESSMSPDSCRGDGGAASDRSEANFTPTPEPKLYVHNKYNYTVYMNITYMHCDDVHYNGFIYTPHTYDHK